MVPYIISRLDRNMAQPKKLTQRQKQEKKIFENVVIPFVDSVRSLNASMKKATSTHQMAATHWGALRLLSELQACGCKHPEIDRLASKLLDIACEAQQVINFKS